MHWFSIKKRFLNFILFAVCIMLNALPQAQDTAELKELVETIYLKNKLWEKHVKSIDNAFDFEKNGNGSYTLYTVQTYTANLLRAVHAFDPEVLDRLAFTYLAGFKYLDSTITRRSHDFCNESSNYTTSYRIWQTYNNALEAPKEEVLRSAQFAYTVAYAINRILELPEEERTESMNALLQKSHIIFNDHLWRLIYDDGTDFQVAAWKQAYNCATGCYNHFEFLQQKLAHALDTDGTDIGQCNMVTDIDLWIIATTAEMLLAHHRDPALIPVDPDRKEALGNYLDLGRRVIASRVNLGFTQNWDGEIVPTASFSDTYLWQNNTQAFAGDTNFCPVVARQDALVGWDISHARRFVHVFESLYQTIPITGGVFPTRDFMVAMSNQYAYNIFNGNFTAPAFNNYFSGSNGWYRYNYAAPNRGFGPSQLSFAAYGGGFGFWTKYNPDIAELNSVLYEMASATDGMLAVHRDTVFNVEHDHCATRLLPAGPIQLTNANEMLMFLPQFFAEPSITSVPTVPFAQSAEVATPRRYGFKDFAPYLVRVNSEPTLMSNKRINEIVIQNALGETWYQASDVGRTHALPFLDSTKGVQFIRLTDVNSQLLVLKFIAP